MSRPRSEAPSPPSIYDWLRFEAVCEDQHLPRIRYSKLSSLRESKQTLRSMTEAYHTNRISIHGGSNPAETAPTVKAQQFLFVNQYSKDQTQETHGDGRESIGSFVQRTIQARKRLEKDQRLRSNISNSTVQTGRGQYRKLRKLIPLSGLHDDIIVGGDHADLSKITISKTSSWENSQSTLQATKLH